jgi:hypothetical protein
MTHRVVRRAIKLASMVLPKLRLQSLLTYVCTVITKRESTTGILRVSRLQEFLDSQSLRIARQAIDPGKPLRLACHYYVVHNFAFCYLVTSGARLLPALSGTNLHADRYDL